MIEYTGCLEYGMKYDKQDAEKAKITKNEIVDV